MSANASTQNLKAETKTPLTKEDYNNIPVHYCKECGSLRIMNAEDSFGNDYCDACGSTFIGLANIRIWLELQRQRMKLHGKFFNKFI